MHIRPDGPGCNSPVQRAKHTPFLGTSAQKSYRTDRTQRTSKFPPKSLQNRYRRERRLFFRKPQLREEKTPEYFLENKMIKLYKPQLEDLWFRKKFMSDEATMSYNHAYGGTIAFPESTWSDWYNKWILNHENKRFYRYLKRQEPDEFIGEIAYYFDSDEKIWIADIIIASIYRGRGYGTQGLNLLCKTAAENGINVLYDNIAIDNPSISLFLKNGFHEESRTDKIIILKKDLQK